MNSPHSGVASHTPVMLPEVISALAPAGGEVYVDGTFGAGGYSTAILQKAACKVVAFDRDPRAIAGGLGIASHFQDRLTLVEDRFGNMAARLSDLSIAQVDGIVLDIGVSSMQVDEAERGFSFMRDGPLDMRMSQQGMSAADVVNALSKDDLANVIFLLGEERRSRAIASSIIQQRGEAPLKTTFDLVRAIERVTGRQRAVDKVHPATRTFQALRIYVNSELEELSQALHEAEQLLVPGGRLVVVTFHSLEDRIVKRFLAQRSGKVSGPSRHQPDAPSTHVPTFQVIGKAHFEASESEIRRNPRARSAKLRHATRTAAPAWVLPASDLSMPIIPKRFS